MSEHKIEKGYGTLDTLLLLQIYRTNVSSAPADLRDIALRLLPHSTPAAKTSVLEPVAVDANPEEMLDVRSSIALTLTRVQKEYVDKNLHGLLIYRGQIAPIDLKLKTKEDLEYAVANEADIYEMIARQFVIDRRLKFADVTILLFSDWGFSNLTKIVTCRQSESSGIGKLQNMVAAGVATAVKKKAVKRTVKG